MPLYEYQCDACGERFEMIQKFSDPPAKTCPSCGADRVRKLLAAPAIQFKGSGWYITDYAQKGGGKDGKKADEGPKADAGGKADTSDAAKSAKGSSASNSTPSTTPGPSTGAPPGKDQ